MEKHEILKVIKDKLINKIIQYHQSKQLTHLTQDDVQTLSLIWREIMNSNLSVSCSSCVGFALDVIESYYQREGGKA